MDVAEENRKCFQKVQYVMLEKSNMKMRLKKTTISVETLRSFLSEEYLAERSEKFTSTFISAAVRVGEEMLPIAGCVAALREFHFLSVDYLTRPMASVYTVLEVV